MSKPGSLKLEETERIEMLQMMEDRSFGEGLGDDDDAQSPIQNG